MWNGFPMMAHTAAARSGVDALTKTIAAEWCKFGVRVNHVAPGMVDSGGLSKYPKSFQDWVRMSGDKNFAARLATNSEISSSIVFLLSPAAQYISGVGLRVDAGESLSTF